MDAVKFISNQIDNHLAKAKHHRETSKIYRENWAAIQALSTAQSAVDTQLHELYMKSYLMYQREMREHGLTAVSFTQWAEELKKEN